jgi:hypothetical protein
MVVEEAQGLPSSLKNGTRLSYNTRYVVLHILDTWFSFMSGSYIR